MIISWMAQSELGNFKVYKLPLRQMAGQSLGGCQPACTQ
jgi:hypothetical protein